MDRRNLLKSLLFAPAIVGAGNIMKIKPFVIDLHPYTWVKTEEGFELVQPFRQMSKILLSKATIYKNLPSWQDYERIINLDSFKTSQNWVDYAQG